MTRRQGPAIDRRSTTPNASRTSTSARASRATPIGRGGANVLYIGGSQRSGSTLLDRMVSQVEGHVSAGEIVHLWHRGVLCNELCGCGTGFWTCPFWTEVGREAFGGWDRIDPGDIIALQRRTDRNRYIFFMLFPSLSRRYRRNLAAYTALLAPLYAAIGARGPVVVDSSKHPSTAFLLRRVPGVRLRLVHLVRDSRGVVYSLSKKVRRPEVVDHEAFMHRRRPWRAASEWLVLNALFHLLRLTGTPTTRVRYEDVVRDPRVAVAALTGGRDEHLGFVDGTGVTLAGDHTVAGNPMRFARGHIDLRLDDAWRSSMPRRDRRLTTLLTAPLLKAYGYRLRPR